MLHLVENEATHSKNCTVCESGQATFGFLTETFDYGVGDDVAELQARVPVWSCSECDSIVDAEGAEEVRHAAICDHLGVLNPQELRTKRQSLGFSQDAFSKITKIGIASIKRWESGSLIQSKALDNFIRLLDLPGAVETLSGRHTGGDPKFRTDIPDDLRARAKTFNLRAVN